MSCKFAEVADEVFGLIGADKTALIAIANRMHSRLSAKFGAKAAGEALHKILQAFHALEVEQDRRSQEESHARMRAYAHENGCSEMPFEYTPAPPATAPGAWRTRFGGNGYWKEEYFSSAYQVLREVAPSYRYKFKIRQAVERDLLRWSELYGGDVRVQIVHDGRPVPVFERLLVTSWLAAGGRAWIIAELDKRSDKRVVAFPGGGRRA